MADLPEFELAKLGIPMRDVRDAFRSGLFDEGIFDLFIDLRHYRVKGARFVERGGNLFCEGTKEILQKRKGVWKHSRSRSIMFEVDAKATVVVIHNQEGRLILVASIQKTAAGEPIKFVLYRKGDNPDTPDFQIENWQDSLPAGGTPEKSKMN